MDWRKRKLRRRRRMVVVMVMVVAVAVWLGGYSTGYSFGMSSLIPIAVGNGKAASEKPVDVAVEEGVLVDYPQPPDKTVIAVDDTKQDPEIKPGHSHSSNPDSTITPQPTQKPEQTEQPNTVEKPAKGEKVVALTFDDGPDARYTPAILDILKDKDVKATFFVVGQQIKKDPDVLKRIVEEGHVIGNHSANHKNLAKLTKEQVLQEINDADELIREAVGFTPELFRAPYGSVSDTLKSILEEQDRELVGWNVDTRDWAGTSIADMRANIKKNTKPGSIILMHSFGSKSIEHTVKMLPHVIDDLREMGYSFVTADQLQ